MSDQAETGTSPAKEVVENVKSRSTWLRLVFMILFSVLFWVAETVIMVVTLLQFLWKLFSADTNARLTVFGNGLARYIYQITQFLTFNTEERPFPFDDWPGAAPANPRKPRKRAVTPKAK